VRTTNHRRCGLGVAVLLLAGAVGAPGLAAINIELLDSDVSVIQNLSKSEVEEPANVQGRSVTEFRDADKFGSPDWTPTGSVDGNPDQAWLRNSGAEITTTTTVSGASVSIHMAGDDNDGRCEIWVDNVLKARLDMNDSPGTNRVQVIVDNLSASTHTILVDDIGASQTGTGTDCAVYGAAVLDPPMPLAPGEIGHVIVVMMENRSFDHFMGWVPNADTAQSATYNTEPDDSGTYHSTYPLAPDYQGCDNEDPNHGYLGGRCEWHDGLSDGWLFEEPPISDCETNNDLYAIGYYEEADLDFYSGTVANWTVLDNYFSAIMSGTWANKFLQLAADTDRLETGELLPTAASCLGPVSRMPSIFDLLDDKGVSSGYYYVDVPFVALWGAKYVLRSHLIDQFYTDAANGNLPAVTFIDPKFMVEENGTSIDDHPRADIRAGQTFLNDLYEAVITSPHWTVDADVVFIINYDEWGGFYDHVDPKAASGGVNPPVGRCQADLDLIETGLRGFRVPVVVISPWAERGSVASGLYDHTSILKLIEWNWELPSLNQRDLTANNLAAVLTASNDTSAPTFTIDPALYASPICASPRPGNQWGELGQRAAFLGFEVPSVAIPGFPLPGLLGLAASMLLVASWVVLGRRR
jgi:phospholipase C